MVCAFALLLSACAGQPSAPQTVIPIDIAQRTLSVGFQQLSDRYVEYVPVGTLGFEGLRGLNALDPDFDAVRAGDAISFGIDATHRHVLKAPDETDADGWASLAVNAVMLSQPDSSAIATAPLDRIYEAIFDGSLSLLDSHSRYSGAAEAIRNREKRSGFGGIGIVVQNAARGAAVVQVMAGSPAIRAGLVEGDVITHVDGHPIGPSSDMSNVTRGPIGTSVVLNVAKRNGETVELDIKRQRVIAPTVEIVVHKDVVTARISGFNRSTTRDLSAQVNDAIAELHGAARGLVLDLRGNPGGLLSEAVRVADLFISEGRILTTQGRHPASIHTYDAGEDDIAEGLPMAVLVNSRSASASEIVAAALQDHDRAIVIGSSSYGKGTVQMVLALPNEGELTITWSRFLTPSGYILNGLGVHPSICTSAPGTTADQVIYRALDDGSELTHILETWRDIDRHSEADRRKLRALCPASDLAGDLDNIVAEAVIGNANLYQRFLAFAPTAIAAGHSPERPESAKNRSLSERPAGKP
jgi:carboxyl-terminal processing protease